MKRRVSTSAAAVVAAAACGLSVGSAAASAKVNWSTVKSVKAGGGMAALVKAAKAEKTLNTIALPSDWANYGTEIKTFEKKYGIHINDEAPTDSSAQELQAIKQGKGRSSAPDVVDVGQSFSVEASMFAPYKVQTWKMIPRDAKDASGRWYNDYGGYISFGCDMSVLKSTPCPTTWKQLEGSQYKDDVALNGAIGQAAAATDAVWAAALNTGGSLSNPQPGIDFFNTLKSDGNFNSNDCNAASVIEAGQCPILINWDYLNTPKAYGLPSSLKWKVVDPKGKVLAGYYVQAISKNAPHPAAARLWEEFLYSTQGQNIWLEGGARPIELPAMVKAGTENKKAYAALPKVNGTPALPTVKQSTHAGNMIAAAFPS